MTWTARSENLAPSRRLTFHDDDGNMPSRRQVLDLWASDDAFCTTFSRTLADAPMMACFWETPPLDATTLGLPFECVLVPSAALAARTADPKPFAAQLAETPGDVIAFQNLGGDAALVVPRDLGEGADHAHLAAFLRTAPAGQVRQLWQRTGQAVARWVATGQPCWISTSGLGVSWLHIRIDARPKYYSHAPYRSA